MNYQASTNVTDIALKGFDAEGTAIKLKAPVQQIVECFQQGFYKEWNKRARGVALSGPIVVEGNFVRIDEGSRWMRYLLSFFAGYTVLEVEGSASVAGEKIVDFHFVEKGRIGAFGGNSAAMLKQSSIVAAKRAVQTILKKANSGGR